MNRLHTRDLETSNEFCGFIAQCKIFDTAIIAAFSKKRDLSSGGATAGIHGCNGQED